MSSEYVWEMTILKAGKEDVKSAIFGRKIADRAETHT